MKWGRKNPKEILLDPVDSKRIRAIMMKDLRRTGYFSKGYPCLQIRGRGYKLHQLILGKPDDGLEIDHINRNKLDNRRSNLRIVTHEKNMKNSVQPMKGKDMIKITAELIPGGVGESKTLGILEIANDGTGDLCMGNYRVRLRDHRGRIRKWGEVKNFWRAKYGVWRLAFLALQNLLKKGGKIGGFEDATEETS